MQGNVTCGTAVGNSWTKDVLGRQAIIKGRIGWKGLKAQEYTDAGPYLVAGNHIVGNKVTWDQSQHLSRFRYDESPEIKLQVNDVIISKDGTIGRAAHIDWLPGPATINSTMMLVRVIHPEVLNSRFVFYLLQGGDFQRLVAERVSGSTVPHLFQADMRKLSISFPAPGEQREIAHILTTLDDLIERTEALIAKYQAVKQGLMHDLLTRGVDENGELRPSYEEAPELYRRSPLGWMPSSWKCQELGSVIIYGPQNGIYKPASDYGTDGVRIVRIDGFYEGVLENPEQFRRVRLLERETNQYLLARDDILINRVNSFDFVGKSAIVPELDEPTVFESNIMRLRVDTAIVLPVYAIRLLTHDKVLRQLRGRAKSAIAQVSINQDDVRSCMIGIPSVTEQRRLAKIVDGFDARVLSEEVYLGKLELLKRGLMQDLLTGRVRVKVDGHPQGDNDV